MICSGRLVFYIHLAKMESLSGVFDLMPAARCMAIYKHSCERQSLSVVFIIESPARRDAKKNVMLIPLFISPTIVSFEAGC